MFNSLARWILIGKYREFAWKDRQGERRNGWGMEVGWSTNHGKNKPWKREL